MIKKFRQNYLFISSHRHLSLSNEMHKRKHLLSLAWGPFKITYYPIQPLISLFPLNHTKCIDRNHLSLSQFEIPPPLRFENSTAFTQRSLIFASNSGIDRNTMEARKGRLHSKKTLSSIKPEDEQVHTGVSPSGISSRTRAILSNSYTGEHASSVCGDRVRGWRDKNGPRRTPLVAYLKWTVAVNRETCSAQSV